MALELARCAGPKAKVLVDTGHHYQGTNVEQIVAGALYVPQVGIINPSEMSPTNSIEAAVWVALVLSACTWQPGAACDLASLPGCGGSPG